MQLTRPPLPHFLACSRRRFVRTTRPENQKLFNVHLSQSRRTLTSAAAHRLGHVFHRLDARTASSAGRPRRAAAAAPSATGKGVPPTAAVVLIPSIARRAYVLHPALVPQRFFLESGIFLGLVVLRTLDGTQVVRLGRLLTLVALDLIDWSSQ